MGGIKGRLTRVYLTTIVPCFRSSDVGNLFFPPKCRGNFPMVSSSAVSLSPISRPIQFTHSLKSHMKYIYDTKLSLFGLMKDPLNIASVRYTTIVKINWKQFIKRCYITSTSSYCSSYFKKNILWRKISRGIPLRRKGERAYDRERERGEGRQCCIDKGMVWLLPGYTACPGHNGSGL